MSWKQPADLSLKRRLPNPRAIQAIITCIPLREVTCVYLHFPLLPRDSMRMKQPSVRKRRRLAAFRTTGCREQPISAQGSLERVLQTASRSLPLARRFSRTKFAFTNPDWRAHRILDVQCIQRCWNSQLALLKLSVTFDFRDLRRDDGI